MEEVVAATGGDAGRLEPPPRVLRRRPSRCRAPARSCGSARAILDDARAAGADAIVVACPMCHSNLDFRQRRHRPPRARPQLPVLFLSELVGLALGLDAEALGLERHFVSTRGFVARARAGSRRPSRPPRSRRPEGGRLMARIGVFVCHCGENIGRTVDCARVAEAARDAPRRRARGRLQVHVLRPGAGAASSRRSREKQPRPASSSPPARRTCTRRPSAAPAAGAGLNPFLCEMANIREHCSWVHEDREAATDKAIDLVRIIVEKVKRNVPLEPIRIPVDAAGARHRRRHRRHPGRARHRRRRRTR